MLLGDGHEKQAAVWRPILGSGAEIRFQQNSWRRGAVCGNFIGFIAHAARAVGNSLPIAGPQGVMLVAGVGQPSAGATLQIEYTKKVFAIVLVIRRDKEKAPIGGDVRILITNLMKLAQFLAILFVSHEP